MLVGSGQKLVGSDPSNPASPGSIQTYSPQTGLTPKGFIKISSKIVFQTALRRSQDVEAELARQVQQGAIEPQLQQQPPQLQQQPLQPPQPQQSPQPQQLSLPQLQPPQLQQPQQMQQQPERQPSSDGGFIPCWW